MRKAITLALQLSMGITFIWLMEQHTKATFASGLGTGIAVMVLIRFIEREMIVSSARAAAERGAVRGEK